MAADAEAQVGILVQHLAWLAVLGRQVPDDEFLVEADPGDELAHGVLAALARIGLERGLDVGGELFERVGHGFTLFSMAAKIARAACASPPSGRPGRLALFQAIMSKCAHGTSSGTNSLRYSAAVMAPPKATPGALLMSATLLSSRR